MPSNNRVGIRKLTNADAELLTKYANNPKIAANLRDRFPSPYTLKDAQYFIDTFGGESSTHNFCITLDNDFVGMIGFFPLDDIYRFNAEFGYWVAEPYWGQGIASEAIRLIMSFARNYTNLVRIFAGVFEYNEASARVLAKNGFTLECRARKAVYKHNRFWDEDRYVYIIEREEKNNYA